MNTKIPIDLWCKTPGGYKLKKSRLRKKRSKATLSFVILMDALCEPLRHAVLSKDVMQEIFQTIQIDSINNLDDSISLN